MINIVIVEDHAIFRSGLKKLLSEIKDFNITAEYINGKEFTDNISSIQADVVLTDIDMPVMDGITATKMALSSFPELKIIALSMHSDSKYYFEMITAGAKGFVLKQASVEDLETAIREVYKDKNFFSEELLHGVIMGMQNIEKVIIEEKKDHFKLSKRENEILGLICKGLPNKEIAEKLFVSVRTIESNKSRLMQKTYTKNTAGLIIWAIKNKIIEM